MARLRCAKCGHEWVRKQKPSRGQLIRCPNCRIALGKMSKPIKYQLVEEYSVRKAINEYGEGTSKK